MAKSTSFSVSPMADVVYQGEVYIVQAIVDSETVRLARPDKTNEVVVQLSEVYPKATFAGRPFEDLSSIPASDWKIAESRLEAIRPIVDSSLRTKHDLAERAIECGVHRVTLHRWIVQFQKTGRASALLPRRRKDRGQNRVPPETLAIIDEIIRLEYLTRQRKTVQDVAREVRRICTEKGVQVPHPNTVRNRIKSIPDFERVAKRHSTKQAKAKYDPALGTVPGVDGPYSLIEIDHTEADIILVDETNRLPIGRCYLTLATDVYSRMIAGFYVSLDPPGALGTGLCLVHTTLPKDEWLIKHGIEGEWPCCGIPRRIHCDNAREFRGMMLERACEEHDMKLEFRQVANPKYGGHIERLIGTLNRATHALPGTTFSSPPMKGRYDSEGKAIFTLFEFETWLTRYIVDVYHKSFHSTLKTTPVEQYRKGILGDGGTSIKGLPRMPTDRRRLTLDFLPVIERTIQNYGVSIDNIHYYSDVLRRWIHATSPSQSKEKRKFIFRMDPRDISTIWFYDPELNEYFSIPYRDISRPPMSRWELRIVHKRLVEEGRKVVSEAEIFEGYKKLRELEDAAQGKTKAVRRAAQRRFYPSDGSTKLNGPTIAGVPSAELDFGHVVPFEQDED